jgi:hypothetical protein
LRFKGEKCVVSIAFGRKAGRPFKAKLFFIASCNVLRGLFAGAAYSLPAANFSVDGRRFVGLLFQPSEIKRNIALIWFCCRAIQDPAIRTMDRRTIRTITCAVCKRYPPILQKTAASPSIHPAAWRSKAIVLGSIASGSARLGEQYVYRRIGEKL